MPAAARPPPPQGSSLDLALHCLAMSLERSSGRSQNRPHPLLGDLATAEASGAASSSGPPEYSYSGVPSAWAPARGFARQREWQELVVHHGPELRQILRDNLRRQLHLQAEAMGSHCMAAYFRDHSPLGAMPELHPLLTHMAFLTAELWRAAEEGDAERVHTLVGCQAMFLDQAAGDQGQLDAAWFLTGLEPPPLQATAQHRARNMAMPFSPLVDPRWLSIQGEYVKELQWFRDRQAQEVGRRAGPTSKVEPKGPKTPKGPPSKKGSPTTAPSKAAAKGT